MHVQVMDRSLPIEILGRPGRRGTACVTCVVERYGTTRLRRGRLVTRAGPFTGASYERSEACSLTTPRWPSHRSSASDVNVTTRQVTGSESAVVRTAGLVDEE